MPGHDVAVTAEKLEALTQLVAGYGPYRKERLRLKLLSKAALLRDEADALHRAEVQFARLGRSGSTRQVCLIAHASELETMALLVAHHAA